MTLDLEALLRQFENPELEFKEALPGGPTLARLACAFANGRGGKLIFGVRDEDRAVVSVGHEALFKWGEYAISTIHDHEQPRGATLNYSKTPCLEYFRVAQGLTRPASGPPPVLGAGTDEMTVPEAAEVEP